MFECIVRGYAQVLTDEIRQSYVDISASIGFIQGLTAVPKKSVKMTYTVSVDRLGGLLSCTVHEKLWPRDSEMVFLSTVCVCALMTKLN